MLRATVVGELVELPAELGGFFAPDEAAEVVAHRDVLCLWRLSARPTRPARAPLARAVKADHRDLFWRAYVRFQRDLRAVDRQCPELALYLAGYLVECRLKVAICDRQGQASLSAAQLALGRIAGREYDLLGGQGHDLDLLWRLAGLRREDLHQPEDLNMVLQWDVSWRYEPPATFRTARAHNEYLNAVRRLGDQIEQELPHDQAG